MQKKSDFNKEKKSAYENSFCISTCQPFLRNYLKHSIYLAHVFSGIGFLRLFMSSFCKLLGCLHVAPLVSLNTLAIHSRSYFAAMMYLASGPCPA